MLPGELTPNTNRKSNSISFNHGIQTSKCFPMPGSSELRSQCSLATKRGPNNAMHTSAFVREIKYTTEAHVKKYIVGREYMDIEL